MNAIYDFIFPDAVPNAIPVSYLLIFLIFGISVFYVKRTEEIFYDLTTIATLIISWVLMWIVIYIVNLI